MARVKAEADRKDNNPMSFRFSPEMRGILEELTKSYGMTSTTALEAGARLLKDTIRKATPTQAARAIEAAKKSRQAP